jgi:purine-binding chemotaxis protein CheW
MTRQVLVVEAGGAHYALESQYVREIAPIGPLTPLPGSPPHVLGLLNLRGQLITLVDLALRLGAAPGQRPDGSVVVLAADARLLGVYVDDVVEVTDASAPEWNAEPARDVVPGELFSGTGHFGDMVVLEVDVMELVRKTLA